MSERGILLLLAASVGGCASSIGKLRLESAKAITPAVVSDSVQISEVRRGATQVKVDRDHSVRDLRLRRGRHAKARGALRATGGPATLSSS